jgi:hypothetical protein
MTLNNVPTYLEEEVETTRRIIWDKKISLKFIHHTQRATKERCGE